MQVPLTQAQVEGRTRGSSGAEAHQSEAAHSQGTRKEDMSMVAPRLYRTSFKLFWGFGGGDSESYRRLGQQLPVRGCPIEAFRTCLNSKLAITL